MKTVLISSILAALTLLSGCGGWTRPNTTEAQFYQDRFQCEQQSASMYPIMMTSAGPGYQAPARTNCTSYGNQTNCTTTPGTFVPASQSDVNAIARSSAFNSCLQSKGYAFKVGN